MKTASFSALAAAAMAACLPLSAADVCGQRLASFSVEHPANVVAIQSTLTPHLPFEIIVQIFSGAKQVRSRSVYNAATGIYTDDLFLVDPGTPLPAPLTTDQLARVRFAYIVAWVTNVQTSCSPSPSVQISGQVMDGVPIYLDPTGNPYSFSFAYSLPEAPSSPFATHLSPTARDVLSNSGGLAVLYQDRGPLSIAFNDVPKGSRTPVIQLSLPPFERFPLAAPDNPYQVDASASFDPNGLGLAYEWSSDKSATFWPSSTSATPQITFNGRGTYNITLKVTNTYGDTATTKFSLSH